MRASIDINIAIYLLEKYPGCNRNGLLSMWASALCWLEERVQSQYLHAPFAQAALEAAALLKVQAICTGNNDPFAKQSFLFGAAELIAPFAKRV